MPARREAACEDRAFAKTALRAVPNDRGEIFSNRKYGRRESDSLRLNVIADGRCVANCNLVASPAKGVVDACKTVKWTGASARDVGNPDLRAEVGRRFDSREYREFFAACHEIAACAQGAQQERKVAGTIKTYLSFLQTHPENKADTFREIAMTAGRAYLFATTMLENIAMANEEASWMEKIEEATDTKERWGGGAARGAPVAALRSKQREASSTRPQLAEFLTAAIRKYCEQVARSPDAPPRPVGKGRRSGGTGRGRLSKRSKRAISAAPPGTFRAQHVDGDAELGQPEQRSADDNDGVNVIELEKAGARKGRLATGGTPTQGGRSPSTATEPRETRREGQAAKAGGKPGGGRRGPPGFSRRNAAPPFPVSKGRTTKVAGREIDRRLASDDAAARRKRGGQCRASREQRRATRGDSPKQRRASCGRHQLARRLFKAVAGNAAGNAAGGGGAMGAFSPTRSHSAAAVSNGARDSTPMRSGRPQVRPGPTKWTSGRLAGSRNAPEIGPRRRSANTSRRSQPSPSPPTPQNRARWKAMRRPSRIPHPATAASYARGGSRPGRAYTSRSPESASLNARRGLSPKFSGPRKRRVAQAWPAATLSPPRRVARTRTPRGARGHESRSTAASELGRRQKGATAEHY